QQWGGQKTPQTHLGKLFLVVEVAQPDLKNVRIVPMAVDSELCEAILLESEERNSVVVAADVIGSAPHVAAHRSSPAPDRFQPVLTKAENHGAAGAANGFVHFPVGGLHLIGLVNF